MNKVMSFVRLDFITIKPYLTVKNLLIFIAVALIMIFTNNSAIGAIAMLMVFAAMFSAYPFVIGEKSNIDVLYTTLSIKRKTVVFGRYLFALTLDLAAGLFAAMFSFVILTATQKDFDFDGSLVTVLVLFLLFSAIQAVQLPIYFKLGYAKAKFLAYLPFFVFPLLILVVSNAFGSLFSLERIGEFLSSLLPENNPAATLIPAVGAVWLAVILVSCKVSVSFYQKRDF